MCHPGSCSQVSSRTGIQREVSQLCPVSLSGVMLGLQGLPPRPCMGPPPQPLQTKGGPFQPFPHPDSLRAGLIRCSGSRAVYFHSVNICRHPSRSQQRWVSAKPGWACEHRQFVSRIDAAKSQAQRNGCLPSRWGRMRNPYNTNSCNLGKWSCFS